MKKLSRKERKIETQKRLRKEAKLNKLLPEINTLFKEIFDYCLSNYKFSYHSNNHFGKGQFVVTGLQRDFVSYLNYVGYIVQIREKSGMFGSDCILVRDYNEKIQAHENQSFAVIPEQYLDRVKKYFNKSIFNLEMNNDFEYGVDGIRLKGFRIPFNKENQVNNYDYSSSFIISIGKK